MKHFYYKRAQRRSALTLLLNIGVLLAMWFAARQYLTPEKFGEQALELLFWINIAAPIVCILLLALASWFWINNKTFEIELNGKELKVKDPLFGDYCWQLPLKTITEIRHNFDVHNQYTSIMIVTNSGERYQLTQNYHFNRTKLYAAIKKVAPHITLPKHANRFTKSSR